MLLSVLAGFIAAAFAPTVKRFAGAAAGWILAAVPLSLFVYYASMIGPVAEGRTLTFGWDWVPSFGVRLSFYVDGLSLLFALLISGIGTLIVLYAAGYLKGHEHQGRFFSFILMFMGSMLGLVLADNVITLFVFWELTSITSFLLIGFDHRREASRRAAIQALVVTGSGGLLLLAGLILMALTAGTFEMSEILASGDVLRDNPAYLLILFFVLGGAFTKSAQFPLHFWLPNAMEAPTPVSAYLHSATMVKAGVYLLMRVNPGLGGTAAWEFILPLFGAVTLLVGTLLAIRQTDLKLMLAYTTVASLGLLVMLTGFGTQAALEAAVLYLFAHSLFKGALFMVAGAVDHEAGTRDVTRLGGLRAAMPITAVAAALAALSMSGIPPFFGFIAKEVIYEAIFAGDLRALIITVASVVGNALMLVVAAAVAVIPFYGEKVETPKHAHEGPVTLWLGPVVLAGLGVVTGLAGGLTGRMLLGPGVSAVAGEPVDVNLYLWHGINAALMLSIVTVALGIFIFMKLAAAREAMAATLHAIGWGPDKGFDQFIRGCVRISVFATRILQPGRMQLYVLASATVVAICLLAPLFFLGELPAVPAFPDLYFYEWGVIAIALVGLGLVVVSSQRLTAVAAMGIQGFAVALTFLIFAAPDLAFTQFMVETLSVVILTLVLTRLDLHAVDHRGTGDRILHGGVAALCGLGFALLLMSVVEVPFDRTLPDFYTEYSYVIAHGRNIVNVILVDFRAIDTLGEITVVLIAGLSVLALLKLKRREMARREDLPKEPAPARDNRVLVEADQ